MDKNATIVIAGKYALVEEALLRMLRQKGYSNCVGVKAANSDLTDAAAADALFSRVRPQYVFLVGGKSGGIGANQKFPADLMLDNLRVDCNVLEAAHRHGVTKLVYLASSCIYPKFTAQPMRAECLMAGELEPTNAPYAVAKLAGIHLCQSYRRQFGANYHVIIPANIFGPGDDFSVEDSHVVGGLMRRMHEAKMLQTRRVEIWGSGSPRREFIYSQDLADACLFIMKRYQGDEPLNVGVGVDWSIRELAQFIKAVVGYSGELSFDQSKPDGMPAKLLDSSPLQRLGWKPQTPIKDALAATYRWFLQEGDLVERAGITRAPL